MCDKANLNFIECIKKLSCSPLLYMNMQRFLNNKPLFEDKQDGTDTYQAVYKNLCEQFFLHHDRTVLDHVKSVCGQNIFKRKNIFASRIPYTDQNHSLYLDFKTNDNSDKLVVFEDFKKAMAQKIYPFQFGNLGKDSKSKFNLKPFFLGILANAFIHGLVRYTQKHCDKNNRLDFLKLIDEKIAFTKETWFLNCYQDAKRPTLDPEWNDTTELLKYFHLETEDNSKIDEYFLYYFFLLYLWNTYTLVVDAFIPNAHKNNRQPFYPNFMGILLIKKNGMVSQYHEKILNDIESELLLNWSELIYKDLLEHNDSSNNYLKASIKLMSNYEVGGIPKILKKHILEPFGKAWGKFVKNKNHLAKIRKYKNAIKKTRQILKRKDRWYYYYSPESFIFDDFRKIDVNPFLSFSNCFSHKHDATNNKVYDENVHKSKAICPFQFLKQQKSTLDKVFFEVENLKTAFFAYVNNHNKSIRLNAEVSILRQNDFDNWRELAAGFLKEFLLTPSYQSFEDISKMNDKPTEKDPRPDLERFYNLIRRAITNSSKTRKRLSIGKEDICKWIQSSTDYKLGNNDTKRYNKIISKIDANDPFFATIDSKEEMRKYCEDEVHEKKYKTTLFFWWLCGYFDYLKNGFLLRKDHNGDLSESNAYQKIKRISSARLIAFHERTCDFAMIFTKFEKEYRKRKENKHTDRENLIDLNHDLNISYNPVIHNKCDKEKRKSCIKSFQTLLDEYNKGNDKLVSS